MMPPVTQNLNVGRRFQRIVEAMTSLDGLCVAFSGGVDSSTVAAAAYRALGDAAVAVTAVSETFPDRELEEARSVAAEIGIRHETIAFSEIANPRFRANSPSRCYVCQSMRFRLLMKLASERGDELVAAGTNASDLGEHRPGLEAMEELGVYQPLLDHDLEKEDVRDVARKIGLSVWNKPSQACLSSRIPHGKEVTERRLTRIEAAEAVLYDEGFRQLRVRDHGDLARIEVGENELDRLLGAVRLRRIREGVRKAGFDRVAVDLEGYRTGSVSGEDASGDP